MLPAVGQELGKEAFALGGTAGNRQIPEMRKKPQLELRIAERDSTINRGRLGLPPQQLLKLLVRPLVLVDHTPEFITRRKSLPVFADALQNLHRRRSALIRENVQRDAIPAHGLQTIQVLSFRNRALTGNHEFPELLPIF